MLLTIEDFFMFMNGTATLKKVVTVFWLHLLFCLSCQSFNKGIYVCVHMHSASSIKFRKSVAGTDRRCVYSPWQKFASFMIYRSTYTYKIWPISHEEPPLWIDNEGLHMKYKSVWFDFYYVFSDTIKESRLLSTSVHYSKSKNGSCMPSFIYAV